MVELEETFITQLQRVADTYKREMQEQHSIRSDLEVRLRAAQLAVHQADTRCEDAQAALHTLQVLLCSFAQVTVPSSHPVSVP